MFFDSFLAFCRERLQQVGVSESGLCQLFPQILADTNVGRASRWVAAVDRLESERKLESLQERIEECGLITGAISSEFQPWVDISLLRPCPLSLRATRAYLRGLHISQR